MRLFLTIAFSLIFFSCQTQKFKIEKQLFECLVSSAKTAGIDLKKELTDFENNLIASKVLKDKSGESYYQIYKQIEKEGDINFYFNYSLLDTISFHSSSNDLEDFQKDCSEYFEKIISSKDYKKSKLYTLNHAMDSMQIAGNFNISEIAKIITRVLAPKDFDQDYYKMTTLLLLTTLQEIDLGLMLKPLMVSDNKEIESIDDRNLLLVSITSDNDSVMLNNSKVSIEDLTDIVITYLISDPEDTTMPEIIPVHIDLIGNCFQSKLVILLQLERNTSYNTFIKVHNKLTDAYMKVRDQKAMEFFELGFDKLSTEQQNSIKEMIPMRIQEADL